MTKITEREIYNGILDGSVDQAVLAEFAEKKLTQLDKRNASAQKRAAAKRAEGDELMETVFSVLTGEPQVRNVVTGLVNGETGLELSPAKVGAKLNRLVADGRVQKQTVKIHGEDGKAKSAVAYFVEG